MKMEKRCVCILLLAIVCLSSFSVSAHPYPMTHKGTLAEEYIDFDGYYDYYFGGEVVGWSVSEDNHLPSIGNKSWTMKINTELPVTSTTIAHEFGHVIGLNDLYDSANSNKLMFGYERRTANGLTAYDRRGAEVILGEHPKSNTPHNFEYVYYGTTYGIKFHAKQCSYCYGFQGSGSTLTGYGACTYGAGSVCTVCGTSR